MKLAAKIVGIGGVVFLITFAVFLSQGLQGWGLGADGTTGDPLESAGRWKPLLPWVLVSGILGVTCLIIALVFWIVSRVLNGMVMRPGPGGPATDEAANTVLVLSSPSLQMEWQAPATVKVQVVSVNPTQGVVLVLSPLRVEMDILVYFDEATRRYGYVTALAQSQGFGASFQKQYGVVRHVQKGRYLTLDGIQAVDFDSRFVYDRIDGAMRRLGWTRAGLY